MSHAPHRVVDHRRYKTVGIERDAYEILDFMAENYRHGKSKLISRIIRSLEDDDWKRIADELNQEDKDHRLNKIESILEARRARQIKRTRISRTVVVGQDIHHQQIEETTVHETNGDDEDRD